VTKDSGHSAAKLTEAAQDTARRRADTLASWHEGQADDWGHLGQSKEATFHIHAAGTIRSLLAESTKPVDAEFQRNFRDPPDSFMSNCPPPMTAALAALERIDADIRCLVQEVLERILENLPAVTASRARVFYDIQADLALIRSALAKAAESEWKTELYRKALEEINSVPVTWSAYKIVREIVDKTLAALATQTGAEE